MIAKTLFNNTITTAFHKKYSEHNSQISEEISFVKQSNNERFQQEIITAFSFDSDLRGFQPLSNIWQLSITGYSTKWLNPRDD